MGKPFDENDALAAAVVAAKHSPCVKSQRGSVVFAPYYGVFASGWNHPPHTFQCMRNEACREHCNKICIHAEIDALARVNPLVAVDTRLDVNPVVMLDYPVPLSVMHVKVVDGAPVPSGPPSCWQCSRALCNDSRIIDVWLLHEDGLRAYSRIEFHVQTLQHCGIPVTK